jgi:NTE family protein
VTQPGGDDLLRADLVCEGGGVKGVALAGAVTALAEAGYSFPRVAGSSAGAIVGALVAALQTAGEPVTRLNELLGALDLSRFRDPSRLGRVPLVGRALSLLTTDGIYQGAYLERFLEEVLGDLGVRTFGDLRTGEDTQQYAYSLVITASDLSRRRLVRLPWDLPSYGVDPDTFSVARAVRASAAIPLFFRPVRVRGATWVDGGLLSNFPVELFDQPAAVAPRWPTFGVRTDGSAGDAAGHASRAGAGEPRTGVARDALQRARRLVRQRPVLRAAHDLRRDRAGERPRLLADIAAVTGALRRRATWPLRGSCRRGTSPPTCGGAAPRRPTSRWTAVGWPLTAARPCPSVWPNTSRELRWTRWSSQRRQPSRTSRTGRRWRWAGSGYRVSRRC